MSVGDRSFGTRLGALAALVGLAAGCTSSGSARSAPTSRTAPTSTTGVTAPVPTPTPSTVPAPPRWAPCSGGAGPIGFQCASLAVPRDASDPSKGMITLALDRRPASGSRIGSLLVNPGGPGASGVDFLPTAVILMPRSLLDRFDIVGFDPPGVARSAPIRCLDPSALQQYFETDPLPPTSAALDADLAEYRSFAAGCEARSGAELPFVSTADAARAMDQIRAALGDQKLSYLGFSYGTFLGATYAELFPDRIRAMVLDGAIDPTLDATTSVEHQAAAFDAELNAFFQNCATNARCPWRPTAGPSSDYQRLVGQVRQAPLPAAGTHRTVGPAALLYGTAFALYSPSYWNVLDQALAAADRGNGTLLLRLFDTYTGRQADGTYSNEFEANAAIGCLDSPVPPIPAIEAAAPGAGAQAPVFGPAEVLTELGCAVWPLPAKNHPHQIHAPGSPPIVVVGSTGDPATPYQEAVSLAGQLSQGVLLTRVGEGHTGYPFSACIRNYVDAYLISLTVPPAGARCTS